MSAAPKPCSGPAISGLLAAVASPINDKMRCDNRLLEQLCRALLKDGCDGLALFGTTGEGPMFHIDQRIAALDHLVEAGIPPAKIVVSASAMTVPDIAALARHATDIGCAGILLMPPFFFRERISDDGVFRFYATAIEQIARPGLKLFLYHFPAMTGVPINPAIVRRLIEHFPANVVGIKDSGGDWDFTATLLTRFSSLAILTGTEVDVPRLLAAGGAGTICGLANVIPGLMRRMFDEPTLSARRRYIPLIHTFDAILTRGPYICCLKAMIAADNHQPDWLRVAPPLIPLPAFTRDQIVADFRRFEAAISTF